LTVTIGRSLSLPTRSPLVRCLLSGPFGATFADTATVTSDTTDPNPGNNTFTTPTITIAAAGLVMDPYAPGKTALYIVGTTGNDLIGISHGPTSGSITVTLNGVVVGTFTPTGPDILIDGLGGYDRVNVFGFPASNEFHAPNHQVYLNLIGVVPSTARQPFVEKGVIVEGIVNC
jgi:hypothetical protein